MRKLITALSVLVLATSVAGAATRHHKQAAAGKCWDAASSTVKDMATQSASGQKTAGAVTTGSGSSGNAVNIAFAERPTNCSLR